MKKFCFYAIFCFTVILSLQAQSVSGSQFKKGEIVLKNPVIEKGKFSFITETGGCTYKKSFVIKVSEDKSLPGLPHYRLTVERVTPDFCKGLFTDGVKIEFDLEKDCGLKGNYTITILNKISAGKIE